MQINELNIKETFTMKDCCTTPIFSSFERKDAMVGGCAGLSLKQLWAEQHPIMHTWFLLSSLSICFLSALLFIIH